VGSLAASAREQRITTQSQTADENTHRLNHARAGVADCGNYDTHATTGNRFGSASRWVAERTFTWRTPAADC
jgi:hypothetical protein